MPDVPVGEMDDAVSAVDADAPADDVEPTRPAEPASEVEEDPPTVEMPAIVADDEPDPSDEGPYLPQLIQAKILGADRTLDRDSLSEKAGIPLEAGRNFWRAMGFADVGEAVAFTEPDLEVLKEVLGLIDRGLLDETTAIEVVRSVGRTTARLADWQVDVLGRSLVARHGVEDQDAILSDIDELLPVLERMLAHVWRRQLAAAVERTAPSLGEAETVIQTVAFADIVGFTRLSRRMDSGELAAMVTTFESEAADVVASLGGHVVKTVGDEILFVSAGPGTAAAIADKLHRLLSAGSSEFQLRIGMATGPVVARMGDVFGNPVNMASRLTALARPGTTLIDSATADGLPPEEGFETRGTTPRAVRGFGFIRPIALSRKAPS